MADMEAEICVLHWSISANVSKARSTSNRSIDPNSRGICEIKYCFPDNGRNRRDNSRRLRETILSAGNPYL
jgi:hypothetical protein